MPLTDVTLTFPPLTNVTLSFPPLTHVTLTFLPLTDADIPATKPLTDAALAFLCQHPSGVYNLSLYHSDSLMHRWLPEVIISVEMEVLIQLQLKLTTQAKAANVVTISVVMEVLIQLQPKLTTQAITTRQQM